MANQESILGEQTSLPTIGLTDDQVAQFHREGFLVLDTPQISPSDVEWCRKVLRELIERGTGSDNGRNFDLLARTGGDGMQRNFGS